MKPQVILYKSLKNVLLVLYNFFATIFVWFLIKGNDVKVGSGFQTKGVPIIDVANGGKFYIGNNFRINNGKHFNIIGRQQPCYFIVSKEGVLKIGNNVGMSSSAFVCFKSITVGNNVLIGGNVVIYDTDFHSLSKEIRKNWIEDKQAMECKEVIIGNDVFIGAHSTILKGVKIGDGSIIGAGSVVSKSIPENEIWAGNPAKFIKSAIV